MASWRYPGGGGGETEGTNKDVLEWTCAEVVRHLKERTDPPVNQSLLDGFDVQEINGATTATARRAHAHAPALPHAHAHLIALRFVLTLRRSCARTCFIQASRWHRCVRPPCSV
jgi:hypothetical protein